MLKRTTFATWVWDEEWTPSSPEGPKECDWAGWICSNCKIKLAEYLSESLNETIYIDDYERIPKLKRCPCCGAIILGL